MFHKIEMMKLSFGWARISFKMLNFYAHKIILKSKKQ